MSLARILGIYRIDGAFCATRDPDIWWREKSAGLARHFCLSHCPVATRAYCRKTAPEWATSGCVAGGYQWTAVRPSAAARMKSTQVPPVSCDECARPDPAPASEPPPPAAVAAVVTLRPAAAPQMRRRRSPGDMHATEIRRLAALAAS